MSPSAPKTEAEHKIHEVVQRFVGVPLLMDGPRVHPSVMEDLATRLEAITPLVWLLEGQNDPTVVACVIGDVGYFIYCDGADFQVARCRARGVSEAEPSDA